MRHSSVLLLVALVFTSGYGAEWLPTAPDGSPEAWAEINARVERWDMPGFDLSKLSTDERRRLAAHEGGISTHPPMMYDVLGVRYEPIFKLPVSAFHEELTQRRIGDGYENPGRELIEKFNIQLVSPWNDVEWPHSTTLLVDLSKNGTNKSLSVDMELRDRDSYYIEDPALLIAAIGEASVSMGEPRQAPRLTLARLEGFEFSSRTISNMLPLGVVVTYNVRFGSVRVDTGFQWAGRPPGIPNGGGDFLK